MPRRYKPMKAARKKQRPFVRYEPPKDTLREIRQGREYPSLEAVYVRGTAASPDRTEQLRISKQYAIAPAYNKGAYQVVPRSEITSIGKK